MAVSGPPGLDLAAVSAWLAPLVGGIRGGLGAELIPGGRSNLTYLIGDDQREWILRRPPLAHVLPTAHDMAREHRVITALGPTAIPVPAAIGCCHDQSVTGAPFYVMERVHGTVIRERLPAEYANQDSTRQTISLALVEVLAALHGVDVDAVGLGDFGRPDGFLRRQVQRWAQQWELSKTRHLPAIDELRSRLTASIPEQGAPAIVHGDFRLDNVMFDRSDPARIVAVLDWEMCTIGDPLVDLGLLLVYWSDCSPLPGLLGVASPVLTAQPGFLSGDQLAADYARRTGRALHALEWYVVLGFYKLAIVAEGIHHRFLAGMTVGDGFDTMGAAVPGLVEIALDRARASTIPGLGDSPGE